MKFLVALLLASFVAIPLPLTAMRVPSVRPIMPVRSIPARPTRPYAVVVSAQKLLELLQKKRQATATIRQSAVERVYSWENAIPTCTKIGCLDSARCQSTLDRRTSEDTGLNSPDEWLAIHTLWQNKKIRICEIEHTYYHDLLLELSDQEIELCDAIDTLKANMTHQSKTPPTKKPGK